MSQAARAQVWAVGDLQGCCQALDHLLEHPDLASFDEIWFAGDLVNRGPASLATLRRIKALGDRAVCVLGNHDLHLLGVSVGARHAKPSDTLQEILDAPDAEELLEWLRHRPLMHQGHGHLMVHAGLLPSWSPAQALALAQEVEAVLRGPHWRDFLHHMYGNSPASWNEQLQGHDRWRVIVNACTRLRFCSPEGRMEFEAKENAAAAPPGYLPWFDIPGRASANAPIVFGHWSTLGLLQRPNLLALDTGCVWGGQLSAVRLHDRHYVGIDCSELPGIRQPG